MGSPISESSTKIAATIGQYADFINSSDLALDVAINKMVAYNSTISVNINMTRQR